MKLTKINNTFANATRLKQIINVFWKYGFTDLIDELDLFRYLSIGKVALSLKKTLESDIAKLSMAERAAMAFQDLGPTFIKVGQLLSTRTDMLPPDYIKAFDALKDDIKPFPFAEAKAIIEKELTKPIDQVFEFIDSEPLAAASISQVHAAILADGSEVVIKVRRPGIRETVHTDIRIMIIIVKQLKKRFPEEFGVSDPLEIVTEFERILVDEMDFIAEAANAERFRKNFKQDDYIHIPQIYLEHSTKSILIMEQIHGIPLRDIAKIDEKGYSLSKIAERVFNITLQMFFVDGFFHGDLHAGNVFVTDNNKLALIDFGMVGYLDHEARTSFYDCFSGMFQNNIDRMIKGYLAIGALDENVDIPGFKSDLSLFAERYFGQIDQVDLSQFFNDVIIIAKRHQMTFPTYFFFVGKTFAVMEGTIKQLDSDFDFEKYSHNFIDKIMKQRLDPSYLWSATCDGIHEISQMMRAIPHRFDRITKKVDQGKLKFIMEMIHPQEDQDLVEKLVNRVATSFIVAGMIIGSSIIIISKMDDSAFGMPLLGVAGFILSFIFGSLVIFSIYRSGKW